MEPSPECAEQAQIMPQCSLPISRLDGGADVGKAVVLVADRIEAAVGPMDARGLVEPIELARLQRHGGDVAAEYGVKTLFRLCDIIGRNTRSDPRAQ